MATSSNDIRDPLHYKYDILNKSKHEIRLVHLLPHARPSPKESVNPEDHLIECRLTTVDLASNPIFEALSYEWGPADDLHLSITLDGCVFPVRKNLWWALYYLRHETEERIVWIDAICINQNDETGEKNHQVSHMGRIYSSASMVIAWMGRAIVENIITWDDKLLDQINFCAKVYKNWQDSQFKASIRGTREHFLTPDPVMEVVELVVKRHHGDSKFIGFVERKYWYRAWIIQEVVLAKNLIVQCEYSTIPWSFFSAFVDGYNEAAAKHWIAQDYLMKLPGKLPARGKFQYIAQTRQKFIRHLPRRLMDLIIELRSLECKDDRDRIFSLLDLSCRCCKKANMADYGLDLYTVIARLFKHNLEFHYSHDEDFRQQSSTMSVLFPITNASALDSLWRRLETYRIRRSTLELIILDGKAKSPGFRDPLQPFQLRQNGRWIKHDEKTGYLTFD